jgi:PKD repeat protein
LGVQSTIDFGNLGVSTDNFPLAIVNNESTWLGFSVDNVAGRLIRLSFINPCAVSTSTSAAINPSVFFTTPGNYKIALKSFDALGNSSSIQKIIAISAQQAPDIDFTYQNICANNLVNFTSINASGNINSYNWDFGNSNTSSTSNPSSIYAGAGSYVASLNVSAINGCSNFAQKNIQIFNQPTAFFTLPSASPICTNQNYTFTNTTTFDAGTNPTWQWSVNDTTVAITQNLAQAFASATSKQIKLIASIPGCSSTTAQTISSIEKGPEVSFSAPSSGCQEVSIDFSSTTTGAVSSYLWDFGDGNTTNSQNPTKTFTTPGSYSVSLMATNPVGCQNSATKNLTIYSKPNPNFSIGLPPFSCSGTASQFNDLTPSPTDSNITSWSWSFGDSGSGSSAIKNPTYTFSIAGSYNVSLQVGTNFGCTDSIQKSVTIAQSPQASFSNLAACVNQGTQFTDTSTGGVKSRIWQMGFTTSTNTNPIYTFTSAGSFPVLLTVTGSNNCVSQVSKNVNVPLVPELDFSVEKPCTNSTTIFTEVTNSIDPSSAQSWAFGSLANANESPVQYSFVAAGTYLVRLNSTRKSGCVYSLSKNISVVDSPVAAFIPSIEAGPSPLGVSFTNNSVFSTSYLWDFGDSGHTTSSQPSPVFVFTELGDYKVELRASNSVGCSSKTSKVVQVVIPHVDAVMTDFYFVKDATTNALQPVVTLVNKSNVSISDPIILIDVMGGSRIKKKIISTLKPSQQITQSLDLQLVPTSGQYVCAEVQVSGDEDLFLNRRCVTLTGEEILFAPFPNPVKTELNLDWISKNASPVTFQIVNSSGGITFQQTITAVVKGINRFVINTSEFTQGIYYIQFSDHEVSKAFNFVVSGN